MHGKYEESVIAYDKALQISPNDFEIYANRGAPLRALEKYQLALESYDKA